MLVCTRKCGADAVAADVKQIEANHVTGERDDPDCVAGEVVTGVKGVGDVQTADRDVSGRQQRLLHLGRQAQVLLQSLLGSAQALLGDPAVGDVRLDADEVRHLA